LGLLNKNDGSGKTVQLGTIYRGFTVIDKCGGKVDKRGNRNKDSVRWNKDEINKGKIMGKLYKENASGSAKGCFDRKRVRLGRKEGGQK
jgi:hypothetical protein